IETARRPHQSAGNQKTAQLVGREQGFSHVRVARNARISSVTHDRLNDSIRIAAAAQNVRAGKWMLIGRRKHLVIKVGQESHQTRFVHIGIRRAVTFGTRAHGCFDGQSVLAQALALGVFTQQFPCFFSIGHQFLSRFLNSDCFEKLTRQNDAGQVTFPLPLGLAATTKTMLRGMSCTVSTTCVSRWDQVIPSAYADGTDCAPARAKPSSPTLLPRGEGESDCCGARCAYAHRVMLFARYPGRARIAMSLRVVLTEIFR